MSSTNAMPKLSEETIAIMTTNLPLFEAHSTEIVLNFYDTLFRDYPSVKKQFNMYVAEPLSPVSLNSHRTLTIILSFCRDRQKGGSSLLAGVPAQISSLASFILRFVKNISAVEKMQSSIERVAHKHISRGVTPAQYEAMSSSFLSAVREVLAPDEAMMSAWRDVFEFLTTTFVSKENQLREALTQRAGYSGFAECDVVKIRELENSKLGIWILPREAGVPEYKRGQFVGVVVEGEQGEMICTCALGEPQSAEKEGMCMIVRDSKEAATRFLQEVKVGDCLKVSVPCGKGL